MSHLGSILLALWVGGFESQLELTEEHDRFLNEQAVYIITDPERQRFLGLRTHEERDAFIESFWQIRDPIPETAVNEFREKHFKRMAEANRKFREARAGWQTERGRMYITLGEPNSVMTYPNQTDLYPLEIWYYYSLDIPRFPAQLHFIFYKRNGVGEYRLFSPAFDGFRELVADRVKRGMFGFGGTIPAQARQLWDIDIIKAAEGVGPGEGPLSSEVVLADVRTPGFVFEKTRKNLGEQVTATASFGREIPLDFTAHFFRGSDDFTEVHLSLEIAPENVNVNQYDNQMLGRFDVIGTFRRQDTGDLLEEVRDSLEIALAEEDWDRALRFPILFQKKVRLLPGPYRLELYVRDFVGRGLGVVDRVIYVPGFPSDRMAVSSVVAAFKADEVTAGPELPHQFGTLRLYPRPNRVFGDGQRVLAFLEVYYPREPFEGAPSGPEVSVRYTLKRDDETVLDETNRYRARADAEGAIDVLKVISGPALTPGKYVLEATLTEPTTSFDDFVSLDFTVDRPQEMGRLATVGLEPELPVEERVYREAHHYLAAGRYPEAIRRFKVALDYEPFNQAARLGKARAEILGGDVEAGAATAREAIERDPKSVEGTTLLAFAQFRSGALSEAAATYRKAIELGGESPSLLNALGETEFEAGNLDAALRALTRSLELQPEQPRVQEFLEQVKATSDKRSP
ncbi:MAG TPA: GWxTD domain-containing protein [Vicinamibacteria bacterium]|nr:GWxTD domain-containing protein [Vicinamibacteria bacterium]